LIAPFGRPQLLDLSFFAFASSFPLFIVPFAPGVLFSFDFAFVFQAILVLPFGLS
jgi:hypothetical protein